MTHILLRCECGRPFHRSNSKGDCDCPCHQPTEQKYCECEEPTRKRELGVGRYEWCYGCNLPVKPAEPSIHEALEKVDKQIGGALRALGGDVPSNDGWEERFEELVREYKIRSVNGLYEDVNIRIPKLISFIRTEKAISEAKGREVVVEKLKKRVGTKEHICAFNDGEQSCECYNKALTDAISLV